MKRLVVWLVGTGMAFAQLAIGVKGGLPLTDFLKAASSPASTFHSGTKFILGPTIELHLPAGFGIELDALYRRFDYRATSNLVDVFVDSSAKNAWEFPLLLKYKASGLFARPFLDAGVAFDRWTGLKQVTNTLGVTNSKVGVNNTGMVVGGGLEIHAPFIRISPEIRFTRWGAKDLSDFGGVLRSNQNQAEFLIGLTF